MLLKQLYCKLFSNEYECPISLVFVLLFTSDCHQDKMPCLAFKHIPQVNRPLPSKIQPVQFLHVSLIHLKYTLINTQYNSLGHHSGIPGHNPGFVYYCPDTFLSIMNYCLFIFLILPSTNEILAP